MKFKALIFDMDGTIIDTEHIWNQATKGLITQRGVQVSPQLELELSKQLNGMALPQSCKFLKDLFNLPDSVDFLMQEKSRRACDLYSTGVRFITGFVEFHATAKSLGLKIGLATNADDPTLAITNKLLNLEQFFGIHMYNITHVNFIGKPDPRIYLHTAQQLDVDPTECLVIEDSAHGVKAAKGAGMFCIGINSSGKPEQTQEADMIIDAYHEIELHALLQIVIQKN